MFSSSPTYEHHADDSFKDSPKKPTIVSIFLYS